MRLYTGWLMFFFFAAQALYGQTNFDIAKKYLGEKYKLQNASIDWLVTDEVVTKHNGVTHVYLRQTFNGIEIFNANVNVAIKNGQVVHSAGNVITKFDSEKSGGVSTVSAEQAVHYAARNLGLVPTEALAPVASLERTNARVRGATLYNKAGISRELIPVKKIYVADKNGRLTLCWDLSIYEMHQEHWWSMRISATDGEVIQKDNWVSKCDFGSLCQEESGLKKSEALHFRNYVEAPPVETSQYRVIAYPGESPLSSPFTLVTSPADAIASPFGWHDTNGVDGAEYTITRGNNVYAYEDSNAQNMPGNSVDGGAVLDFDFQFDPLQSPVNNLNAGLTNLFYVNNTVHDVFYHYGFDEASGNFQFNNYGKGGVDQDPVQAEAQDGGGVNNANFATPPDGSMPRMQMYLWTPFKSITVNTPASIAGDYVSGNANFGPAIATAITADIIVADDNNNSPSDGCSALVNDVTGKIVLVDRGSCTFKTKVLNAQNGGAIAVIVVDNSGSSVPLTLGDDPTIATPITIPAISILQADGNTIKAAIALGGPVNITIPAVAIMRDGCFDNIVMTHEYGHGISTRLTGGPANSSCLTNGEQMGEGWSDYFGLMLTMKSGDVATTSRTVGNYDVGLPLNGPGIRLAPYTTDMTVNGYTYDDVKKVGGEVHDLGFVWATMLWDMTWAFIDRYGFDPDIKNGTGGNNMALQLVIDGLKLQPCSPGFVDGRDAILLADQINNNGANRYLIWAAFAKRGLGASASEGDPNVTVDGVAAFDMPQDVQVSMKADRGFATKTNIKYSIMAQNVSPNAISNITIQDALPNGLGLGSLPPGGSYQNGVVSFPNLMLQSQEERTFSFQAMPTGGVTNTRFTDDMEAGAGKWNMRSVVGDSTWMLSGYYTKSGTWSWRVADIALPSEQLLVLKNPVHIDANTKLAFYHAFSTEYAYDGGVVEVSIDGGTNWQDLGAYMIQNSYNATIDARAGTTLASRKAFTGYQGWYYKTTIDLGPFSGHDALVRFRWVNDGGNSADGWYLDDIYFYNGTEVEAINTICGGNPLFASSCMSSSVILVDTPPMVAEAIADGKATMLQPFQYILSGSIFTDADGDQLSYAVQSLPGWLHFDSNTRTFSGTPGLNDRSTKIHVTATDPYGAFASEDFNLTIDVVTGIEPDAESVIALYPNPTMSKVRVASQDESVSWNITLRSSLGEKLMSAQGVSSTTELDLSSLPSGVYVAECQSNKGTHIVKVVKQ